MECNSKNRQETITNYLEGRLSRSEQDAFEEHLFNCDECYRELGLQEDVRNLVQREGNILFEDYLKKKRLKQNIWEKLIKEILILFKEPEPKWVYVPLAIATIVLLIFLIMPSSPPIDPQNFKESTYLEDLMSTRFRSSYSFEIESPKNGINIEDDLEFKWNTDYEGLLFINIFNNREEKVLNFTVENNQLVIQDLDEKLPPGLYYWKLESKRSIFFIGKFFVLKPQN